MLKTFLLEDKQAFKEALEETEEEERARTLLKVRAPRRYVGVPKGTRLLSSLLDERVFVV
jgi:hypothetical protein